MKFLHVSDLHIGKVIYKRSMIADQRFALERLLELAQQHQVDALVLAGDIYDAKSPSSEAVALVDWLLTSATQQGLEVLAIPGNHDSADKVGYASRLLARQGVHMPPVFDGTVQSVQLHDQHGPVTFWLLPFLAPPLVRPHFPDQDIGTDYNRAIQLVLDTCPLDQSQRNVLVAHQFVVCGSQQPQLSDSETFVGGTGAVDASLFDAFDYVALGHIHRPQHIGRDHIRYAGSLLKYSVSEIPYEKSAVLVQLGDKGDVDVDLIPLPPLHDMRQIRGPLQQLLSPQVVQEQPDVDDYLHVVLTDLHPQQNAGMQLSRVYPNLLDVVYDNDMTRSQSSASQLDIDESDLDNPLQLFQRFYAQQTGTPLSPLQEDIAKTALERALDVSLDATQDGDAPDATLGTMQDGGAL